MDDPLPGCNEICLYGGNWNVAYRWLYSHVQLVYSIEEGEMITKEIHEQCSQVKLLPRSFLLNEMAFEFRHGLLGSLKFTTPALEKVLITNWSRYLLESFHTDEVLEFVHKLKILRDNRLETLPFLRR